MRPRWHRKHALLLALVLLVLCVHLGLLDRLPHWQPLPRTVEPSQATMQTRRIDSAPASPPIPAPSARAIRPSAPLATAKTQDAPNPASPAPPGHELNDPVGDLTSPLALPARTASAVDLPPFKRQDPEAPPAEAAPAAASKPPEAVWLSYSVHGTVKQLPYSAWGELRWQPSESRYEARLEIGAFLLGTRTQTSSGLIGHEGLMPERFTDSARNTSTVQFLRDTNTLQFSASGSVLPLLKGTQDRLSVVLQLSSLLAGEPERYPPGTMLSIPTATQQDVEVWQLLIEKMESLSLPYGNLSALKLSRTPRQPSDQRIEMWFAPSLGYLPVRLRITNADGDQVDQQLKGLKKIDS